MWFKIFAQARSVVGESAGRTEIELDESDGWMLLLGKDEVVVPAANTGQVQDVPLGAQFLFRDDLKDVNVLGLVVESLAQSSAVIKLFHFLEY